MKCPEICSADFAAAAIMFAIGGNLGRKWSQLSPRLQQTWLTMEAEGAFADCNTLGDFGRVFLRHRTAFMDTFLKPKTEGNDND